MIVLYEKLRSTTVKRMGMILHLSFTRILKGSMIVPRGKTRLPPKSISDLSISYKCFSLNFICLRQSMVRRLLVL